jgi:hypothetical protein
MGHFMADDWETRMAPQQLTATERGEENMQEFRVCSHDRRGCFEYEFHVAKDKTEAIHCAKGQRKNRGLPPRAGYTAVALPHFVTRRSGSLRHENEEV